MKIRPLYDRVVVRRKEEETATAGGILLPGSAKEKPNQGEVVAVGAGKALDNGTLRPMALKPCAIPVMLNGKLAIRLCLASTPAATPSTLMVRN